MLFSLMLTLVKAPPRSITLEPLWKYRISTAGKDNAAAHTFRYHFHLCLFCTSKKNPPNMCMCHSAFVMSCLLYTADAADE